MGKVLHIRKLADKSDGERVRVPVLTDLTLANGEVVQVPTGEVKLVNPATPGTDHEPWPLAGVQFVDEVPEQTAVSTGWLDNAVDEGWARRINERMVRRPSGPASQPGATRPHVFVHCDEVVFDTVDGEIRYRVTHQPDKYVADGDDETPMTSEHYAAGNSRVDWYYGLELVN